VSEANAMERTQAMSRSIPSLNGDKVFGLGTSRLGRLLPVEQARSYLILLVQICGLLAVLALAHALDQYNNFYSVVLPLAFAVAMVRARYAASNTASVRLLQLIGVITGAYALAHYPLFPVVLEGVKATVIMSVMLALWLAAVVCGVLCLRWPSLAVVSASYLYWSKYAVIRVTGLWHGHIIDVQPLYEVSVCLIVGLTVMALTARLQGWSRWSPTVRAEIGEASALFSTVLIAAAISIHLANYFSSFLAKATLDGGLTSWLLHNDPSNLFMVGLDNNHVLYVGWPWLVDGMRFLLSKAGPLSNAFILIAQGAALFGILMPRRWLLVLLLGFDVMHLSIIIVMGANFAPWILLNLAIAAIVVSRHYQRPPLLVGLFSVLFILSDNRFMSPAWLGWYDTAANNKMFFEAVDKKGDRHYVPTNFFTFYSYPFAHMAVGSPDATTAFALDNPNGGTQVYRKVVASQSCDVPVLTAQDGYAQDTAKQEINGPALDAYIRGYHALARRIGSRFGNFPYALYPHHFFVPLQFAAAFDSLAMDDIVAYVYRRESVCLKVQDGTVVRQVVSEAEHRIDLHP
jgi:hypothetical protein